ncbi:MAG TPA: 50S ribosomal protein L4 [Gaiellaceae bacterium]|nr:50S ribosomal protein L4 [Gaiellaceae bacterium]
MAAPTAPVLNGSGKRSSDVTLEEAVFGADVKPHLVHEAVRAEQNAQRAGTFASKSRGLVAGGRAKPWRQKGTGRARAGTVRAAQFKGGGHAFAKSPRSFIQKVNRKAQRAAMRSALASHAQAGTLALVDGGAFDRPSTKQAEALVAAWEQRTPIVIVCTEDEANVAKSFRNLQRVAVVDPCELEVGAVVWARSLLVTEAALPVVQGKAQ